MLDENKMDKLDEYLLGKLSEQERADLEADAEVSEKLEMHQAIFDAVSEKEIIDYRKQLDAIQANMDAGEASSDRTANKPGATVRRMWPVSRVLAVAASVAILLIAAWYLVPGSSTLSPDDAFAAHYQAPKAQDMAARSATAEGTANPTRENLETLDGQFRNAFEQGNYQEALAALSNMTETDPDFEFHSEQGFYYNQGITYLQLQEYEQAATAFAKVKRGEKLDNAYWYRAMALLKTDPAAAKEVLQQISERQGHPQRKLAGEILNQLP